MNEQNTPRLIALLACEMAWNKKARDVILLDLRKVSDITDYFVLASGSPEVHVRAIADAVIEGLEKRGVRPLHREGYGPLKWVLLDYDDVVVHVFHEEARKYYDLDGLWGDAEREVFE